MFGTRRPGTVRQEIAGELRLAAEVYEPAGSSAALRDALLPKLLSGAVRVPDVERFVAPSV